MSSNELFIKNKSEKHLYNNSDKSKVERYEEEYESSYSPNKHKNNHVFLLFLSKVIKMMKIVIKKIIQKI